jgi:hypothetical protein
LLSSLDDCDERLRAQVLGGETGALDAALALMERHDPRTLRQALAIAGDETSLNAASFEIVAEAWDRYFHIRHMSWD